MFSDAKWIWTEKENVNQYVELRTEFELEGDIRPAIMRISADNEYAAYINGALAGWGQYDDFPMHKAYNTHDVSALVRPGRNELVIKAYHQGVNSYQYLPGPAGVIFALTAGDNRVVSGGDCQARPYALYFSGDMEKVSGQLGYTFACDATAPAPEWERARVVTERAATELYPRPVRELVTGENVTGTEVFRGVYALRGGDTPARRMQRAFIAVGDDTESADGRALIFDLGRESTGFFNMEIYCPRECELLVGYGEHLDDGRVRTAIGPRNFAFSYRAAPGETRFEHIFRRIAGRYIQIFAPFDAEIRTAALRPVDYPVTTRGGFSAGDRMMNLIYDTSVRTLRLCMHEHYEDTPWREQGLYAMDSRNQALCGYTAFGESEFPYACLRLMAESIRPDGLMEICSPAKDRITIPSFSLGWVISLRDYALYTGETEKAGALMPAAMKMLGFFKNNLCADGLTATPTDPQYWNFYEWAPGLDDGWDYGKGYENTDGNRRDAPLNLFYAHALGCAADVAEWSGDIETAAELRREKQALIESIDRVFWDGNEGLYRTYAGTKPHYCQLAQALAVLCGAATGDRAKLLRRAVANEDPRLIPATLSYLLFVYEALIGDDEFRAAAVENARALWGGMILRGATSFWETIEGADAFAKAGSLCHGWSAVPAWLWYSGYLGVRPLEPGYRRFTFAPLGSAEAVIPTPFGDMRVRGRDIEYNRDAQTLE